MDDKEPMQGQPIKISWEGDLLDIAPPSEATRALVNTLITRTFTLRIAEPEILRYQQKMQGVLTLLQTLIPLKIVRLEHGTYYVHEGDLIHKENIELWTMGDVAARLFIGKEFILSHSAEFIAGMLYGAWLLAKGD